MHRFFLLQSTYKGQPFVHETDLDGTSRDQLVDQLALGQFDTGTLDKVLMIDLSEGVAVDVSVEFAQALHALSHRKSEPMTDSIVAFVGDHGLDTYVEPIPAYYQAA